MRSILKWSIPIVLVGAAVWLVLSIRIRMPIDHQSRIDTPAGPIDFRVLVFPGGPVRIEGPREFHDINLPAREINRIYSEIRKGDQLQISLSSGADISIRQSDDDSWHGFWTAPATTGPAPSLPVSFFGREPRKASNDPAAVPRYEGRWRIRAADGTSALLDLYPLRDASGLVGVCSAFTGEFELGGHADADGLRLTFFDGERAVAVRGRLEDDGTLSGDWWASQRGMVSFTADRE
jgi:hypothetical protein